MEITRRRFLRASATLAGASALGARGSGASMAYPREGQMEFDNGILGFGTVTYNIAKDLDLDTLLAVAARTRLDAVELRTTHAHGVELSLPRPARAQVRKKFEDAGLVLAALGSTCEFHSPYADVVARNIEETKAWCQLAEDVGALGVKVRPNGLPEGVPVEKTLEQIGTALLEVGPVAADHGVEVFVEVHGDGTQDPVNMARIMEVCDHPSVGVTWNCNDADMVDGSIAATFPLLRDRVRMVHLKELVSDYPLKEELIPFLLEMGFDRYCLAEVSGMDDPERFLRYYKALFDEMVWNVQNRIRNP